MPWAHKAKALVQAWYGGNETGNGIADVLFGDVNPSGKLPLSWPAQIQDCPSYLNFGSSQGRVLYGEDIYVGYRFYEKLQRDTLFCFGYVFPHFSPPPTLSVFIMLTAVPPSLRHSHGLSYTTFEFSNLSITPDHLTVSVKNSGKRAGAEVIQVYIAAPGSAAQRPVKELHGFEKVYLQAGETKLVKIAIDKYATSFWDESESDWKSEAGKYEVLLGTSSSRIVLKGRAQVDEDETLVGSVNRER